MIPRDVLITGGTGYLGRALSARLVARGHRVRVLARPGSGSRVVQGATAVTGDPLDIDSIAGALRDGDVVVQLVGTSHPGPGKAQQFKDVDLASIRALTGALAARRAAHVIYVSVAHPAPVMRAYIDVRREGERLLTATGIPLTILRPWYVVGPGHRWPILLTPLYAAARHVPPLRAGAERLGLVRLEDMVAALTESVEREAVFGEPVIVDVPGIRALGRAGVES